jgi:hypothetical protein
MDGKMKIFTRHLFVFGLMIAMTLVLSACGGSTENAEDIKAGIDSVQGIDSNIQELVFDPIDADQEINTVELIEEDILEYSDLLNDQIDDQVDEETSDVSPGQPAVYCSTDKDCRKIDQGQCQPAYCDLSSGICRIRILADGIPCDDGDSCTMEVCNGGECSVKSSYECGGGCGECADAQACVMRKCLVIEELGECPGGGEVVSSTCGDVPTGGCCEENSVLYCGLGADGQCPNNLISCLCKRDCGSSGQQVCTWDPDALAPICAAEHFSAEPTTLQCEISCQPICEGLECGPDGCGGVCGTCDEALSCVQGQCIDTGCPDGLIKDCDDLCGVASWLGDELCDQGQWGVNFDCEEFEFDHGDCAECVPACDGVDCGPDGCGGVCGLCNVACQDGVCQEQCALEMIPDCNGNCNFESWIGDDICDDTEHWNFFCEAFDFDAGDCDPCVPNCEAKVCGGDGCGGSCGECTEEDACVMGACIPTQCPSGQIEDCLGQCAAANWVGDAVCDQGETGADFFCEAFDFDGGDCQEEECIPNCEGKECGSDGCQGDCGQCLEGGVCEGNICIYAT